MKNRILILLMLTFLVASCARRPSGVLSNREMERVLVDLHRADGILQVAGYNYGHDADVGQYYQVILDNNGVTQAQFDSSLVWYTAHPAYFSRVYPKVLKRLQAMYDEESYRLTEVSAKRIKMSNDSIFLQKEPAVSDVVAHACWETHRTHTREIYVEREPESMFTAQIIEEMHEKAMRDALGVEEDGGIQAN